MPETATAEAIQDAMAAMTNFGLSQLVTSPPVLVEYIPDLIFLYVAVGGSLKIRNITSFSLSRSDYFLRFSLQQLFITVRCG